MHYVSLVKVHGPTRQDSLDKAADLFYCIMLAATVDTQSLLLVTPTLRIVVPVMLASGVTVGDNYNLFTSTLHILHLCILLCVECILHNQGSTSKSKGCWQNMQWLVQYVHVQCTTKAFQSFDHQEVR